MFSSSQTAFLRPLQVLVILLVSYLCSFGVGELVRCRLCFGKVSTSASNCIHCGEPDFKPIQRTIEIHQLQDRDEIFFAVNGEEPFTGLVVDGRYASGLPKSVQEYKDGRKQGQRTKWYENGQIMQVCFFEDGELHGVMEEWYENGLRMAEEITRKANFTELFGVGIITESREAEYPYEEVKL